VDDLVRAVIDLASRRVVGFAVAEHMRTSLVEEAMEMALTSRRPAPGLIFHSDRGSQYTSLAFRELLARHHMRQSLSRPRQCWDNAVAESFFATLKTELVYRHPLATVAAARTAVFEYIEVFYNRKRLHSALGYQSPSTYETCTLNPPTDGSCRLTNLSVESGQAQDTHGKPKANA
jgi:transposase InsO family protein